MPPAPTTSELLALAELALDALGGGGEAQATVSWERRLAVGEHGAEDVESVRAELVVLRDGRVGAAAGSDLSPGGLERTGAAAVEHAALDREPGEARRLPDPAAGRDHGGWDPAVPALDPGVVVAELAELAGADLAMEWRAGAARVAVASTRGVRASEQRTFVAAEVRAPGRPMGAATGPDGLDVTGLVATAEAGFHDAAPQPAEPGDGPVVLGPVAVAQLLELLKPQLAGHGGLLAARRGTRIVAPAINLSDSPRYPGTLPRAYDAEGMPRRPVPLIQDGVAHQPVSDTASGGSTGHATRPAHPEPWPSHLVLVGGGAADADELAAPVALGLHIPALLPTEHGWRLDGAKLIEAGARTWPVSGLVEIDPVAVLGTTEALSSAQQLVAGAERSARSIGATLAPALRARGGVTVVG